MKPTNKDCNGFVLYHCRCYFFCCHCCYCSNRFPYTVVNALVEVVALLLVQAVVYHG